MDLLGRVLSTRYRLDHKLGTGGSARVYAARDLVLDRDVAIKVLHPALSDDARFLRRFEAEARAAASLQHPHIVSVFDSGRDAASGLSYMVLELVEGGTLQDLLDEGRTLTPPQVARVGAEVCSALGFAHRRGMVHCDVKPGNILITLDGRAKVADFGLARALAEAAWTEPLHTVLGTARYSPPEMLAGAAPTVQGDLYSLGLVLVELVSGSPVFAAETPVAVLVGRLASAPALPAEVGPLHSVLEAAIATDPADRPTDALAMQAELESLSGDGPVVPANRVRGVSEPTRVEADDAPEVMPSPAPRRRRRRLRLLAAVALIVAVAAAAVPLWVYRWGASTVPELRGLDVATARDRLARDGVRVTVMSPVPDYQVPAGQVKAVDPLPGSRVRWRGAVTLVPSGGLPRADVPDLNGKTLDQAIQALSASQLRTGEVVVKSDGAPSLTVLDHEKGNFEVGDAVDITVSSGVGRVLEVPSVKGMTRQEAEAALAQAGFGVTVTEEFSDDVEKDRVISQDLEPGLKVKGGRDVALVVSKGPDLIEVPFVRALPVADAVAILEGAGLQTTQNAVTGTEFVLKTDPDAGQKVRRGQVVVIFTI